jgi:hypothetical protein
MGDIQYTSRRVCDLHEVIRIGNEVALSKGCNSQQNDYSLNTWLERKFAVEIYLRDAGRFYRFPEDICTHWIIVYTVSL